MNVLEIKCLRSLLGMSQMDKIWDEEVSRRAGMEWELASKVDRRVSRWFGHMEGMDEHMEGTWREWI